MPASPAQPEQQSARDPNALMQSFERLGYIADRSLATAVYLITKLRKPLLIEGHAGLGKTEVAKILAAMLGTQLIRLQCYEGSAALPPDRAHVSLFLQKAKDRSPVPVKWQLSSLESASSLRSTTARQTCRRN